MVEYVFENKRLSKTSPLVVFAPKKGRGEILKQVLTSDELKAVTRQISQNQAKNDIIVIESANRRIIVYTKDLSSKTNYKKLGGTLYPHFKNLTSVTFVLNKSMPTSAAYEMALGIDLGSYSFDKYITKRDDKDFPKLEKVYFKPQGQKLGIKDYLPYAALATGVRYTRDLANEPANNMTPVIMADDIKRLEYLGLEVDILDEKRMKSNGFYLALSVAQGSINPPRVAVIKWVGNKAKKEFDLGLVGKGVTFDSGGISLKPGSGMWEMKQDMSGAAAVVGALKAIALQKSDKNVVGIVGLIENMPSGTATRPGDIVTSMSGQTVEILNTDAEGRLVLADCLWYIQNQYKVKKVVDIATLTGAITVALGSEMAGIMSNNQPFADQLKKAATQSGDEVWQLPITKAYDKMMNSNIADMKNISESREAGSITAACFLQRFIQKDVAWVHVDMAGMDNEKKGKPLTPKGATGYGVQLFVELIKNL